MCASRGLRDMGSKAGAPRLASGPRARCLTRGPHLCPRGSDLCPPGCPARPLQVLSLPLPVVRQWCLLPSVSAVVSRRLPATPGSVLRAAVLARGPAAPQCAATVAMLPNGTESWMSDGDDAGDCPEVCGCQSPESECVPSLLRCLQSLPGVSALIVLRLSTPSLRVLAR